MKNLRENALAAKWYIPVKLDEAFGVCLTAAVKLAQEGNPIDHSYDLKFRPFSGNLEKHRECKEFVDIIVPEAFHKVNNN